MEGGQWTCQPPDPKLPEPCLGVNFARDGMARKDWLARYTAPSFTHACAIATAA
jgi:hypothetical protein